LNASDYRSFFHVATGVQPYDYQLVGRLRDQARSALSAGELLGIEGTAARLYFARFTLMITPKQESFIEHYDVNGRTRRPPTDPINVVLSYCYGLLVKDLVAVCLAVGLDPFIGVLHRPRFGRPSLALDLAEEFRPLVADSVVLQVINNGEVDGNDFFASSRGVTLTPNGRKQVIRAYERRLDVEITHPGFGYKISYRRVMDVQARLVAEVMIGEIPEYTAMVTR
jgi:CRISPR-associated protein Cas1